MQPMEETIWGPVSEYFYTKMPSKILLKYKTDLFKPSGIHWIVYIYVWTGNLGPVFGPVNAKKEAAFRSSPKHLLILHNCVFSSIDLIPFNVHQPNIFLVTSLAKEWPTKAGPAARRYLSHPIVPRYNQIYNIH